MRCSGSKGSSIDLSFVAGQVWEIHQVISAGEVFEIGRLVLVIRLAVNLDAPEELEQAIGGPVRQRPYLWAESVAGYREYSRWFHQEDLPHRWRSWGCGSECRDGAVVPSPRDWRAFVALG